MYRIYFITKLNAWLTKVNNLFKNTAGNTDNMLYVDNPTGRFSFVKNYAIIGVNIATTAAGITQVRQDILNNSIQLGWSYVNQVDRTIDTYNQTTQVWDADKTTYDQVVLPGRYYYSPWNRTIWLTTSYGELKRFRTTTLTKIG